MGRGDPGLAVNGLSETGLNDGYTLSHVRLLDLDLRVGLGLFLDFRVELRLLLEDGLG